MDEQVGYERVRRAGSWSLGPLLLVLFALPFLTVSCMGQQVATVSGYALATGGEASSVDLSALDLPAEFGEPGAMEDELGDEDTAVDLEPFALVALLLAVAGLLVSLVPTARAAWAPPALVGIGGAGALALVAVRGSATGSLGEAAMVLSVGAGIGWWLALLCFLGWAALNGAGLVVPGLRAASGPHAGGTGDEVSPAGPAPGAPPDAAASPPPEGAATRSEAASATCANCGAAVPAMARFCTACGQPTA